MANRTYVPTFIRMLRTLCIYVARYRNTLVSFLDDFGVTNPSAKVDAVVSACEAITNEYTPDINP